jgi:hypothetical protein
MGRSPEDYGLLGCNKRDGINDRLGRGCRQQHATGNRMPQAAGGVVVMCRWGRLVGGRWDVVPARPTQGMFIEDAGEVSGIRHQQRRRGRHRQTQQQCERGQNRARPVQTP